MDPLVLLVDDHTLLAQSIAVTLRVAGMSVRVVEPSSPADILAAGAAAAPATVLLDLRLGAEPGGQAIDGMDLVAPLTAAGCTVLVLTAETGDATWGTALERGAACVLSKNTDLDDLVRVVSAAHAGESLLDESRRQDLLAAARRARAETDARLAAFRRLSRREAEVLRQLAAGSAAATIAADTHVSEATIRSQIRAVLAKLEVTSQLQAVALARRSGWLDWENPTA